MESLARWVKLTGKGQVPQGPWWEASLRTLLAIVAMIDVPAAEGPRIARWTRAAKALGPVKLGEDFGPLDA